MKPRLFRQKTFGLYLEIELHLPPLPHWLLVLGDSDARVNVYGQHVVAQASSREHGLLIPPMPHKILRKSNPA